MDRKLTHDGLLFTLGQEGVKCLDDAYRIMNHVAMLPGLESEFTLPRSEARIIPERYGLTFTVTEIHPWRLRSL